MTALSAYDHIAQNNRKTVLLLALFPITLCILVFLACLVAFGLIVSTGENADILMDGISFLPVGWRPDVPSVVSGALGFTFAFIVPTVIFGVVWMAISLFFGSKIMMAFSEAKPIRKQEAPQLYRIVENTAIMAGLPMPTLYIIEDESLNAFASGLTPKTASVAVTRGLLDKLSSLELQGVIAHELAHIGNRDMRLNMIVITCIGFFGFVGDLLLRTVKSSSRSGRRNSKKNSGGAVILLVLCVAVALLVFNYVFVPIIHMAISRTREYAADATGAKIIHNPKALADALEKISADARVEVLDKQKMMSVACIASPLAANRGGSTHPPIQDRIHRLRLM